MKNEVYKKLSIAEFTKAAGKYESNHAGIYEMCKKDYPDILAELEKEPFRELLDAGCGPVPMISLLSEKYPDRHYTGLDLTPMWPDKTNCHVCHRQIWQFVLSGRIIEYTKSR